MNKPMQSGQSPGFKCPKCTFFIEISVRSLLYEASHKCPGCGLVLTLDRQESGVALGLVQKLHTAMENLESTKRFENRPPGHSAAGRRGK